MATTSLPSLLHRSLSFNPSNIASSSAVHQSGSVKRQFEERVSQLNEDQLAAYIKSSNLDFMQPGDVIEIKSNSLRPDSLIILSDRKIFPIGENGVPKGEFIDTGSVKRAYRVRDLVTGSYLVITHTAGQEQIRNVEKEYRLTQKIDSPHVLKIQSYGVREGQVYAASKLCQGGKLSDKLQEDPDYLRKNPELLKQIEQGYKDCHIHGIVQRDNHSGNNVFISEEKRLFGFVTKREALLADFGSANETEDPALIPDPNTSWEELSAAQQQWMDDDQRSLCALSQTGYRYPPSHPQRVVRGQDGLFYAKKGESSSS